MPSATIISMEHQWLAQHLPPNYIKVAITSATILEITSAKQALTSGNNITTWQ